MTLLFVAVYIRLRVRRLNVHGVLLDGNALEERSNNRILLIYVTFRVHFNIRIALYITSPTVQLCTIWSRIETQIKEWS
jgi:hypothetical protein